MTIDTELDLVIERFMHADPADVWKAWTTPRLLGGCPHLHSAKCSRWRLCQVALFARC
jgi:hypothetical protein